MFHGLSQSRHIFPIFRLPARLGYEGPQWIFVWTSGPLISHVLRHLGALIATNSVAIVAHFFSQVERTAVRGRSAKKNATSEMHCASVLISPWLAVCHIGAQAGYQRSYALQAWQRCDDCP